jgi:glycosyltransferase involved in cell wall biosynthesis
VAITNGYDAADFGHGAIPPAAADSLRIVHTGMFHAELAGVWDALLARRGVMNKIKHARRPINLWTRTPRYLLEAIARVPELKVELVLVGELSPQDRAMIEASPVRDRVRMLGYKSHGESVAWLESADVLFLPLHSPLDGGPTLVVPGKAYEYLGSGRPILATCPPGDMREFVDSSHSGLVTAGDDVSAIAAALAEFARAKAEGRSVVRQDRAAVERFERRALTGRLAGVLEEVVGRAKV